MRELAAHGLERVGRHGPVAAMGVPRDRLPSWDDLQFVTAQLARLPLLDDDPIDTTVVLGPKAALARGTTLAGTATCSGEGGVLPEEQTASDRYLYELGSGRLGFSWEAVEASHAFHFKLARAAKTGTGGIPIGVKLSAQHIEDDLDAALDLGGDYVILDGRGGGTGAAPLLFRDHISVPTIPALARARRHLDARGAAIG